MPIKLMGVRRTGSRTYRAGLWRKEQSWSQSRNWEIKKQYPNHDREPHHLSVYEHFKGRNIDLSTVLSKRRYNGKYKLDTDV